MRIHLKTTPNKTVVPFDYLPKIVGALYKWMGNFKDHGNISLYSFSHLRKGKMINKGFDFKEGAYWFISCWSDKQLHEIIKSIRNDPSIAYGLEVTDVTIQENPDLSHIERFNVYSPVLIKRNIGGITKHFLYSDKESDQLMVETLKNKMQKAGLGEQDVEISFNRSYNKAKTKLITYKGIGNKASTCPLIIKGTNEVKTFAWNVGIGNSTGTGFGAIS